MYIRIRNGDLNNKYNWKTTERVGQWEKLVPCIIPTWINAKCSNWACASHCLLNAQRRGNLVGEPTLCFDRLTTNPPLCFSSTACVSGSHGDPRRFTHLRRALFNWSGTLRRTSATSRYPTSPTRTSPVQRHFAFAALFPRPTRSTGLYWFPVQLFRDFVPQPHHS